jgi:hypothetical protein
MMSETLLSEATVHLFGRESADLKLDVSEYDDRSALGRALKKRDPRLARIYAFVFQNEYFDLASPALFVVDGPGEAIEPDRLASTGLAATPPDLSEDLFVWRQERGDLTVRLDIMAGSFDRVLLDYELADSGLESYVRGGKELGMPGPLGARAARRRRWRSDDE